MSHPVNDAREILNSGADKISINSPAIKRPELIKELADEFGSQCVIASVDVKRNEDDMLGYDCYVNSGSEKICMNFLSKSKFQNVRISAKRE